MRHHSKFTIEPLGDSILRISIFEQVDIELQDAIEMHQMLLEYSSNQMYCVLLDATKRFNISSEARALIAGKEYSSERIATAFVTKSLANKLVGNFFINVNKPSTPTKIFATEESALVWLNIELSKLPKKVKIIGVHA